NGRRPSLFHQALGELCAFLNGSRTQQDLEQFGCYWWDPWVTAEHCEKFGLPPGDLGPGSYGAAFRRFPTAEGTPFDQLRHLIEPVKERPDARHHELSPWIPLSAITTRDCPAGALPPRSDSSDHCGHEALHARQPLSHHRPGIALVAAAVHLAGRCREVHAGRTQGVGIHAVPQHYAMHLSWQT